MMAPVGHTSRQPARTQCLHTSDIISQREPLRKPVLAAILGELLDETHVAPVEGVQMPGVVVRVARQLGVAAVHRRELVPLMTGDLARLAADADRGVGEEPLSHGRPHRAGRAGDTGRARIRYEQLVQRRRPLRELDAVVDVASAAWRSRRPTCGTGKRAESSCEASSFARRPATMWHMNAFAS